MVKKIIGVLAIFLMAFSAQAQNSIGVNTDSPNPNAAMDIKPVAGQAQGVLIPRLTTAERTGMSLGAADNGLMVYDETLGSLFIWTDPSWNPVAIEGSTIVTVDGVTINGDGGITPLGVNVGTGPDQIVQLDGSSRLPAVDGSLLTGITPALNPGDVTTTEILDGTITGADIAATTITDGNINDVDFSKVNNVPVNLDIDATDDLTTADVGNAANQIVQLDGSARLPAVDGSQLTGVTATIGAGSVTTTEIADGTIAGADIAGTTITDANINDVDFGKITNVPVNLDVDDTDDLTTANLGVAAGNVVQLDASSRLPNVDGSQLTNLPIVPVNSDGTTVLGDGDATALNVNVGVGANQIVQLDGTSRLPNVDGSQLTNLPIVPVNSDGTTVLGDGDATALNVNVGVGPNQIVQLDGTSRLPNVDGSQLTNLPIVPVNSDGTTVLGDGDATALNVNVGVGPSQIVQLDASSRLPNVDGSQLTNLPIVPVNSDGTTVLGDGDATALNVNVGVAANQIVQLDGSARLPAVDGSLLTNLPSQSLPALSDVNFGPLTNGEVLQFNGTDWSNGNIGLADIGDVSFGALSGGEILRYNGATWDGAFANLNDNGDVTIGAPAAGEVLFYTGSDWSNGNIGLADIGDVSFGALSGGEILRYNGATWDGAFANLNDNGDVTIGAPAAGEVLFYTGSDWANGNIGLADIGDVSIGALSGGEILQYNGSQWASSNILDGASLTLMQFLDNVDNTKVATFDLSGISTATTHSYSFPDASGQIALLSDIPGSSITGAANGLNVNGTNIELGGSLSTSTEISVNGNEFSIRRGSLTNAPTMHVYNDNGSIGTGGNIVFDGSNSSAAQTEIGKIETRLTNNTAGVEASELVMSVKMSGSLVEGLRIDDVGEVNANAYKYNSPVTKYYGIPPVAFNLTRQSGTGDNVLESNGGSSIFVKSGASELGAEISAPVNLPDGAIIQAVEIFGRNQAGHDATVHFVAKSYSTAETFDDTVIVPDGTTGITGFNIAASVGKVIDNSSNNYFIYIEIPTSVGPTADFSGARITYRMDYVD